MVFEKSIQDIKEIREKWTKWALPTKIGLTLTLIFGIIGFVGTLITIYSFLNPVIIDPHFEENRKENFNTCAFLYHQTRILIIVG